MIRKPVVAGRFYPDDIDELIGVMENCAQSPLGVRAQVVPSHGRLLGLIMPHAGYIFSGPVVTWGLKRLSAEQPHPTRLLLLGPKHTPYGAVAAVSGAQAWKTPLGEVAVDDELRSALRESGEFEVDDGAHAYEHSLEVQLPFLQKQYGKTPFTITPVAMSFTDYEDCRRWGTALAGVLTQPRFSSVCTIISSDFSHETPRDLA
ncbi:MAG TPA: AmmeMemoRadiSam system protein B, partial [Candidatus Ozemobacteraceae bacterium]|nr:AmmeMemoRadiSam system protein B [Candidatus Ozemobacteraceae bacterium]